MADTLNLQTIELESTLRPMGENGAPSSADYNSSMKEIVRDLAALTEFVNADLLPLLNALSAGAALPAGNAIGIQGSTIITDSSDQTSLFYSVDTEKPLTIADTLRVIYGMVSGVITKVNNLTVRVDNLSTSLSTTNQNDVSASISAIYDLTSAMEDQILNLQATLASMMIANGNIQSQTGETSEIFPQSTDTVQIIWATAFPDNTYAVSYGLQDDSGFLTILGYSYLDNGTGILVRVKNTDMDSSHSGSVSVTARARQ